MRRSIVAAIIAFYIASQCYAMISEMGLDPLDQRSGARPLGMAGAFMAVSDDLNALYFNPAGLCRVRGVTASIKGTKDYSLGAVYDTYAGNFGLGIISKSYSGISGITPEVNYENSMLLAGWGMSFGDIDVGLSAKSLIAQRVTQKGGTDVASSGGFDMDFGAIWRPLNYISLAMMAQNILGYSYTLEDSKEVVPQSTGAGIAINVLGKNGFFLNDTYGMLIACDAKSISINNKSQQASAYGAEFSYNNWLFLRGGAGSAYANDSSVDYSSFGVGYKNEDIRIDIASSKDPITEDQLAYISFMYLPPISLGIKSKPVTKEAEKPKPQEVKKELLTINFPQDDLNTYSDTVSIEGTANPKSKLMINGAEAYIAEDWQVMVVQPLNLGKNLIVIEATMNGEKTRIERKVFRKARVVIAEEEGLNKKIVDEVLNKEEELIKREAELKKLKEKGKDVSSMEAQLAADREKYQATKTQLYDEKKKLDDRKGKVENLVTLGVIETSPQKSFAIEAPIKRGEMISWLVKAAGLTTTKVETAVCADVPATHPYATFIKAALDAKLITLSADDKFRPDDPVTDVEGQEFFKAFGVVK